MNLSSEHDRPERVPEWLAKRALLSPEHEALVGPWGRRTYSQLAREVGQMASALAAAGIGRDMRVAVLLSGDLESVLSVYALMRLGAVMVPLNHRLSLEELAWQTKDAAVQQLLYGGRLAHIGQALGPRADLEGLRIPDHQDFEVLDSTTCELTSVHSIMYTSGTTGRPKGAVLTYGNFFWAAIGSALHLGILPQDRWLLCMPLFHVGGLSVLMRSVLQGTTVVLLDGFDVQEVDAALCTQQVTMISLVSTMLQRLLQAHGPDPFPSTLRLVLLGGGPAPKALLQACLDRGVPVATSYGLTESTSQAATLRPSELAAHLGSAGKALLPTDIEVRTPLGRAAPGQSGEIFVRGPTISPGYLHGVGKDRFKDGFFASGDIGYLDDQGYLYVLDRRDDLIVSGGENVYPAQVEDVLLSHPAVAEAAVIGLPDSEWGQVVAAVVVWRSNLPCDMSELVEFCREHLAGFKVPRRIRLASGLPRTANGKLKRSQVQVLWETYAPDIWGGAH